MWTEIFFFVIDPDSDLFFFKFVFSLWLRINSAIHYGRFWNFYTVIRIIRVILVMVLVGLINCLIEWKIVLFLFHPQEWRAVWRRWTASCTWWAGASRPWSHATAPRSSIRSLGRKSIFKSSVHCTYLCHSEAEHQTFFVKELQAQDVIFRNWFEKFCDVRCVLICTRIN